MTMGHQLTKEGRIVGFPFSGLSLSRSLLSLLCLELGQHSKIAEDEAPTSYLCYPLSRVLPSAASRLLRHSV